MYRLICVSGTRAITDRDFIFRELDARLDSEDGPAVLITGGAKGVDQLVAEYAQARGHKHIKFRPYFTVDKGAEYSPRHYFMRNKQMVEECESGIVFTDNIDTGAKDLVSRFINSGKPVEVIEVEVTTYEER